MKLASFPVQKPHPEVWIHGGNLRALRRAIRYGDGLGPDRRARPLRGRNGSTDFTIGSTDEGAESDDPYAELVAGAGRRSIPASTCRTPRSYAWMAEVLEREREAIEARD